MLMATNIHITENKERKPEYVAVFDGDVPQYTIRNIRNTEHKILAKKVEEENEYYINKYKAIYYDGFTPLHIYNGKILDIYDEFDSLREKHDITFIDIVGTLNVAGYDDKFLSNFDYLIIPTNLDYEVLRSTLSFVKNLVHPLYMDGKLKYDILLNNIDRRSKIKAEETLSELKEAGFPVLDTIVYRQNKYISLLMEGEKGSMLSSLFNKYDRLFQKLIDEVMLKIK